MYNHQFGGGVGKLVLRLTPDEHKAVLQKWQPTRGSKFRGAMFLMETDSCCRPKALGVAPTTGYPLNI